MGVSEKSCKKRISISFYLALNWPLGFILLPIGVEFQVELHGTKKSTYRKSPKQRDSNGRPEWIFLWERTTTPQLAKVRN